MCPSHRQDALLEVGVVVRAHGVQGLVRVKLHNPASDALGAGRSVALLLAGGEVQEVALQVVAAQRGLLLVRVPGVADREAAERLRGARILVERESLDPLDEGQYYYEDLVGCQVLDESGRVVGEVHEVFEAGASDILAIRLGATERYVPLVDEWVTRVSLKERQIHVRGIDQWESWGVDD